MYDQSFLLRHGIFFLPFYLPKNCDKDFCSVTDENLKLSGNNLIVISYIKEILSTPMFFSLLVGIVFSLGCKFPFKTCS